MFKYIKAFFKGLYKVIFNYPKICKYAKNKEKYTLEERYAYARKLIKIIFKAFDVKVKVNGLDKIDENDACLYVCNHQGVVDALTMVYLFEKPTCFVSKKEALKYPFVGKVQTFIDSIFIDRENVRDAIRMIKDCIDRLNSGTSVAIFPEGTRTRDENHMPGDYKAGALKPAYETKKKIVVLAIDGGYKVFSKKYKKDLIINVDVIETIDPSCYDVKKTTELAEEIKTKTVQKILEIRKQ